MADTESVRDVCEAPCAKKAKLGNGNTAFNDTDSLQLGLFSLDRILNNNTNRKTVSLLGKFKGKEGDAIIQLEKKAFCESDLNEQGYFDNENKVTQYFSNDIYGNYECIPKPSLSGVKISVVHPATSLHLKKFSVQNTRIVLETPHLYTSVTRPYLDKEQFNLQWLFNVLDGTKEAERVVFSDPDPLIGFVLLPDLKWDGVTCESLYLVAIVRQLGLLSLRSLTSEHLPLLKAVRDKGQAAILQKYGLEASQLRTYLHYQPSFYHLHVHFTFLKHEAPGIQTEKSHMLDTVIDNIEMVGDYYQRATLPCVLREGDTLYKLMREAENPPES